MFDNDGDEVYGFGTIPGKGPAGIKFGGYAPSKDPAIANVEIVKDVPEREIEQFRKKTIECLPASKGKVIHSQKCFYTSSPDSHFIVDKLPKQKRVTIGCGFSGHGFKFMPIIGEILADLASGKKTKHDIDFLSIKRFNL